MEPTRKHSHVLGVVPEPYVLGVLSESTTYVLGVVHESDIYVPGVILDPIKRYHV